MLLWFLVSLQSFTVLITLATLEKFLINFSTNQLAAFEQWVEDEAGNQRG